MQNATGTPYNNPNIPKPSLFERSRVTRFLWAHRGQSDGWPVPVISMRTGLTERAVEESLRWIAVRLDYGWRLGSEILEDPISPYQGFPRYWLEHDACPRPDPIKVDPNFEPDMISLEEAEELGYNEYGLPPV